MEATVDKLEAMFQKSQADLEYIEKRLRLDFVNNTAENGCSTEENPAVVLEKLKALKVKHAALSSQVKEITAVQKESMDSIRNNMEGAMKLLQRFQQTADVEVEPLTEPEKSAAELLLDSALSQTTAQAPPAVAAPEQQPSSSGDFEEVSEATMKMVPPSIRSNIQLVDLNVFYRQLQQHFSTNSSALSVQKMKSMKMKVSDAKLRLLQHLSLVEMDKKGQVRLVKGSGA